MAGSGTADDPWVLKTPPGTSEYRMWRDEEADPPTLVCQVGSTRLGYQLRCIEDLHAMLKEHGDWMELGSADEQKAAKEGTVEAWGRSDDNPVGGWYGIKKGLRGRFGMYVPPLLETLGLAELEHNARNNRMRAALSRASVHRSVVQVDGAVPEATHVLEIEVHADAVRERRRAASHHDRREEQMDLVDQPRSERLRGEVGTADAEVARRRRLHLSDRVGVERPIDPCPRAGCRLQGPRVHDLVGGSPELREVLDDPRLVGGVHRLPRHEDVVHPSPQQERADRALQVVDDGMHVFIGCGPIEAAVRVGDVAVERGERGVDQPRHVSMLARRGCTSRVAWERE